MTLEKVNRICTELKHVLVAYSEVAVELRRVVHFLQLIRHCVENLNKSLTCNVVLIITTAF